MKDKLILILSAVVLGLIVSQCVTMCAYRNIRDSRDTYKRNTEVLLSEVDTFRTANGELTAKVSSLELSQREFEKFFAEDAATISKLRAKNEELSNYIHSTLESEIRIETVVKDSMIYVHDTIVTARVIDWSDEWDSVEARIIGDKADVNVSHTDSLSIAVMAQWKRFLGFLWKTKMEGYDVNVISANPHTKRIDVSSVVIK